MESGQKIVRRFPLPLRAILVGTGLAAIACPRRPTVAPPVTEDARAVLDDFARTWLAPARVAPPTIDDVAVATEQGDVRATLTPLRPEDAWWNQWSGGTARLFNNRAALLFDVVVEAPGFVVFLPDASSVRLNRDEDVIVAAANPDELLVPLLGAAMLQEREGEVGDLVERTRAAGPFRSAYLPVRSDTGRMTGVVAFPLDDPNRHMTRVRVTLAFGTPDGRVDLSWDLD
jgi:hypothetical protein